jgi:hypothetical protein
MARAWTSTYAIRWSSTSGAHILNITSESLEKAELVEENRN